MAGSGVTVTLTNRSGNASEVVSWEWKLDGVVVSNSFGPVTLTDVTYGSHVVRLTARGTFPSALKYIEKTIVVSLRVSPEITTSSLPAGAVGVSYSQSLQLEDDHGQSPFVWSLEPGYTLPAGLLLDTNLGVIYGIPTTASTPTFFVRVTDFYGMSDVKPLSIAVASTGPVITTTTLAGGTVGSAYVATAQIQAATGIAPVVWSVSSGSLPAGLSLNTSTGVISGMPTTSQTASFTIRATDAYSQTDTKSLSIAIAQNLPVIATLSLPAGIVGAPYYQAASVRAGTGTAPFAWSLSSGSLPAGLTLTAAGVISGIPTTDETPTFIIGVEDSYHQTDTQELTIDVTPSAPVISTTTLPGVDIGVPYAQTLQVQAGTGNLPFSWAISNGSLPAGLTLAPNAGTIYGTPTVAGEATFTVRVTDAYSQTDTRVLILAVAANPPVIVHASPPPGTIGLNYNFLLSVQANSGVSPLTWAADVLPAGMSLHPPSGIIGGYPTTQGTVSFTVGVTDACAQTDSHAMSITIVSNPPVITTPTPTQPEVGVPYSYTFTATGGETPYVWSASSAPAWMSINSSTGTISGTPNDSTSTTFQLRCTGYNGEYDDMSVMLTAVKKITFTGGGLVLRPQYAPNGDLVLVTHHLREDGLWSTNLDVVNAARSAKTTKHTMLYANYDGRNLITSGTEMYYCPSSISDGVFPVHSTDNGQTWANITPELAVGAMVYSAVHMCYDSEIGSLIVAGRDGSGTVVHVQQYNLSTGTIDSSQSLSTSDPTNTFFPAGVTKIGSGSYLVAVTTAINAYVVHGWAIVGAPPWTGPLNQYVATDVAADGRHVGSVDQSGGTSAACVATNGSVYGAICISNNTTKIFNLTNNTTIKTFSLAPGSTTTACPMVATPDGNLVIALGQDVYRVTTAGVSEKIAHFGYTGAAPEFVARGIAVASDGRVCVSYAAYGEYHSYLLEISAGAPAIA